MPLPTRRATWLGPAATTAACAAGDDDDDTAQHGFTGKLENRPMRGDNHFTIDRDPALHRAVIGLPEGTHPVAPPRRAPRRGA